MAWEFVGVAWMPATDNANAASAGPVTITPPSGMQAGDHVVLYIANDQLAPENYSVSVTGGQTWTSHTENGANSAASRMFTCIFNGTWDANPQVDWDTSAPYAIAMVVFRGGDDTTLVDQGPTNGNYAAPTTPFDVTIAAGTLAGVTAGAMVIAFFYSNDNNTWDRATPNQPSNGANPGSQAQWRNQGGTDCSISVIYAEQASGGNSVAFTNRQATLGGDSGLWTIIALKPGSGTVHQGAIAVTGAATFAGAPALRAQAALAVTGAATFAAAGVRKAAGAWAVTGAATFAAAGVRKAAGAWTVGGAATFAAAGARKLAGAWSVAGAAVVALDGTVVAPGGTTFQGEIAMLGAATFQLDGTVITAPPPSPVLPTGSAGWAVFTGRRIRQAVRHVVRRLPRRIADRLAAYLEEWWEELLAIFRRPAVRDSAPSLVVGKHDTISPPAERIPPGTVTPVLLAEDLLASVTWPDPPEPAPELLITRAAPGTPIDIEFLELDRTQIQRDREAVEELLTSIRPAPAIERKGATRVVPRALVRRELLVRERRLLVAVRKLLAELHRTMDAAEFRGSAVLGQLHPHQIAALERVWQRHVDEMVGALAAPVRKQEEDFPFGFTSPEELAARQIGELIRELGPAQVIAVRRQLADLMDLGPRPEIIQAIGQATGLTSRQAHAVSAFLKRQLEAGISRMTAARAATRYADRLLDLRARTIARHEAVSFTNQLVLERGRAVGGAGARMTKQWVSSRDDRVDGGDPTGICRLLDNNERIPIDEDFEAGGETFDGPPAHIGCRCLVEIWREG